jgi:FkbM family methyltransferase
MDSTQIGSASTPINNNTDSTFRYRGLRFPIDRSIMSDTMVGALYNGSYETDEANHLAYILQEGERVLELGAGLGLISSLSAANPMVDSVFTVEANPHLIPYIHSLHKINHLSSKITVKNAIATPRPSTSSAKFYRRADLWASSLSPYPWGYEEEIDVPIIDLNSLIESFQPTLLIVDIEGGEESLFNEIQLGSIQKIMMEIHQQVIGRHGVKSVFDALSRRNFHYEQWHSSYNVVSFSHVDRI